MTSKHPGKLIVFLAMVLAAELYLLSKNSLSFLAANPILSIGQLAALLGLLLFSLSFVLASRTELVEEAFGGLDKAYRFHHKIGTWSFLFLLSHLGAIFVSYKLINASILSTILGNQIYWTGAVSIILMSAIILTIIYAKIKYQNFILIQKFFVIPYGFGAYHMIIVNSDVSRYFPLRAYMIGVIALGAIAWIYRELFYGQLAPQAAYILKKIENRGAGITELTLVPEGRSLPFQPGQFGYFSFRTGKISSEPHPFSFASAPENGELVFAAKSLGDFTETLKNAAPGDKVVVYGPYGKFFEKFDPKADNIFVAGGVGITPFLSELRRNARHEKTMLFYSTRSEDDNVYGKELSALSARPSSFKYYFHDSDRRGFLTAEIIEKRAGGLAGKTIYLCGPSGMMQGISKGLQDREVPKGKIIFEAFKY